MSAAGRLKLTVPAGALRTAVSITISALEAYPDGVVGPVFEINPTGLTFDAPVTLTYAYVDAEIGAVPPTELRIGQAMGSQWTALPSIVDTTAKIVSASLAHLSVYGCLAPGGWSDGGAGGASGNGGGGTASVDAGLDGRAGGGGTRITDGGGPTRHFPIPTAASNPSSITAGPDGNLWFTESNAGQIGRITPSGTVTEFVLGMYVSLEARNIIAGPDGNLWFSTYQGDVAAIIGRITPPGAITTFQPQVGGVFDIAVGPDQNLWFTENYNQHIGTFTNQIGRLTPGGTITEFPFPNPTTQPARIVGGPDALWFLESNKIARMTTAGAVTEVPAPAGLADIVALADGNIWFRAGSTIGRIAPSGTQTNFPTPGTVIAFAVGPDQNLWFTRAATLGVITPDGTITETPLLIGPESRQFTWGPDGNLWFIEPSTNTIGRFAQP